MKPVRVYFVCSFLRGLYCLKVCSFQLMENRRVSILKLMGMGCNQFLFFLHLILLLQGYLNNYKECIH
ncbi:hypothetical protein BK755_21585 [Bacillus thuringiensis serovar aizawai]|nr:hypothetical protein BK755_21585 [Bacillus thuringiensis serovar aizawai]